jgi:hypothetical protein
VSGQRAYLDEELATDKPQGNLGHSLGQSLASSILPIAMRSVPAPYLQYLEAAVPLSPQHLQWLDVRSADPTGAVPLQKALSEDAARLSLIADVVPKVGAAWSLDLPKLSEVYRFWLDHAQVPAMPLRPDELLRLNDARSTISAGLSRYEEARSRWGEAVSSLNETLRLSDRGSTWQRQLRDARNRVSSAMIRWRNVGQKSKIESAIATVNYYERQIGGLGANIVEEKVQYERVRRSTGASYMPVTIRPSPFSRDMQWHSIHLDSAAPVQFSRSNVGGATGRPVFWEGADDGAMWVLDDEFPDAIRVGMDVGYSTLDRHSWFDGAVRDHPTSGGPLLSNGLPPPATEGELQMIPHGFVVACNIALWADHAFTGLLATPASSASTRRGFWTITLKSSDGGSLSGPIELEIESPVRAVSRHTHILGIGCSLVPALPNPEPGLVPE